MEEKWVMEEQGKKNDPQNHTQNMAYLVETNPTQINWQFDVCIRLFVLSLKSVSFIMFLENEWIFTRHSTFYGFVWCIYDGAFMSFPQSTFVIYSSINNKYFVRIKLYFMACSLFSLFKQIANHFTFDLCIWDVITKAIHFYFNPTDLKFVDYSVRRDAIVLPHTDSFTRCAHRMLVTQ